MKHSWLLALAALCAAPATSAAQRYTLSPFDGITDENFRNFAFGMMEGWGSRFENGVLVSRGGYGQTFTIDRGSTLHSWGLRHDQCVGVSPSGPDFSVIPGPCLFRGFIAGYDGTTGRTTGVLWKSLAVPSTGVVPPFTPGIWLDPGKYVAFLLQDAEAPNPTFSGGVHREFSTLWPWVPGQAPASPGSELVWLTNRDPGLDPGEIVWTVGGYMDAQGFSATLDTTVTPEPASMALLGTGLAGLAGAARRRRGRSDGQDGGDAAGA